MRAYHSLCSKRSLNCDATRAHYARSAQQRDSSRGCCELHLYPQFSGFRLCLQELQTAITTSQRTDTYVHSVSRNMTGSVSGETQPNTTGKCDEPTTEKSTDPQTEGSPDSSSAGDETSSKKTPLLPPLVVEPPAKAPGETLEKTTDREFLTLPRTGGPCKKKQLHHSSKSASSLPARSRMDEIALLGASSLARRGRAQSYLTLAHGGAADPVFGVLTGEERGFEDSLGARSELSAPVSAARSRRRRGGVRAYGTLERATSYSSLVATPPRPTFRSANSTRPSPAPPCTTTHMDFSRHPVHPASTFSSAAGSRLATPRRNNPHPVGLHFQSPYNRDGKVNYLLHLYLYFHDAFQMKRDRIFMLS